MATTPEVWAALRSSHASVEFLTPMLLTQLVATVVDRKLQLISARQEQRQLNTDQHDNGTDFHAANARQQTTQSTSGHFILPIEKALSRAKHRLASRRLRRLRFKFDPNQATQLQENAISPCDTKGNNQDENICHKPMAETTNSEHQSLSSAPIASLETKMLLRLVFDTAHFIQGPNRTRYDFSEDECENVNQFDTDGDDASDVLSKLSERNEKDSRAKLFRSAFHRLSAKARRVSAVLSLGQTGTIAINDHGHPIVLGAAKLPKNISVAAQRQDSVTSKHVSKRGHLRQVSLPETFVAAACLDHGVVLLSEKSRYEPSAGSSSPKGSTNGTRNQNQRVEKKNEVYVGALVAFGAITDEEQVKIERAASKGRVENGRTQQEAECDAALLHSQNTNTFRFLAAHVSSMAACRNRVIYRQFPDGKLFSAVPMEQVNQASSLGCIPHRSISNVIVGLSESVFFIDAGSRRLLKAGHPAPGRSASCTPRTVTPVSSIPVATACCGYHFLIVVDTFGRLRVWGRNDKGQLGLGSDAPTEVRSFRRVPSLEDEYIIHVAAGRQHSAVLTADGRAFACGDCRYGQIGIVPPSTKPKALNNSSNKALATKHNNDLWNQTVPTFTQVPLPEKCVGLVSGPFATAFVLQNGHVYICGANHHGQLLGDLSNMAPSTRSSTLSATAGQKTPPSTVRNTAELDVIRVPIKSEVLSAGGLRGVTRSDISATIHNGKFSARFSRQQKQTVDASGHPNGKKKNESNGQRKPSEDGANCCGIDADVCIVH